METKQLFFLYKSAKGELTKRHLIIRQENDYYVSGVQASGGEHRTFRKEQIELFFESYAEYQNSTYPQAAQKTEKPKILGNRFEIIFSGFSAPLRKNLENLATEKNMIVRTKVTTNLDFLCVGPNAGPKKTEQALAQGVAIMDEEAFQWLLETGEVPI